MEFSKELLEKAKETNTAEELLALAKANGIELTDAQASALFAKLHQSVELTDEALSGVSGGNDETGDGADELGDVDGGKCAGLEYAKCPACGSQNFVQKGYVIKCGDCGKTLIA